MTATAWLLLSIHVQAGLSTDPPFEPDLSSMLDSAFTTSRKTVSKARNSGAWRSVSNQSGGGTVSGTGCEHIRLNHIPVVHRSR